MVQTIGNNRYKIVQFDEVSNFSEVLPFHDEFQMQDGDTVSSKQKDLFMSELYELKNLWFLYNKKINSLLVILPQDILSRYDMVSKTL